MPAGRDTARWRVPAFLLGLTIFFFWKILFTNRAMFPWDAADFFYPYFCFVYDELRHLRLPLWDPFVIYSASLCFSRVDRLHSHLLSNDFRHSNFSRPLSSFRVSGVIPLPLLLLRSVLRTSAR